jgi:putative Mn2+ efflux pump MntP
MDIPAIVLIAFGLAMDAFAVSITSGIAIKRLRLNHALRIAGFFGSFQAIMPFIGWLAGLSLINYISGVDHWIAFTLLAFIGCKMIYEATKIEAVEKETNPLNPKVLLLLSIATSIDALAVGLSFAILKIDIATPIIIIGTITFVLSFLGAFAGNKLGHLFENKIEIAGGLILIIIGTKILIEHII